MHCDRCITGSIPKSCTISRPTYTGMYSFTFQNAEGMIQSFYFIVLVIVESGNLETASAVFLKLRVVSGGFLVF